jgi:hypothetical protein
MRCALCLGVLICMTAFAALGGPVFVGSYAVYDGPAWETNPPVYSAQEAAALLFGGSPGDYAISIDPSLDPSTITHSGWYDGWGEHSGMIFAENYKLDVDPPGYNDPGGAPTARSAYVHDGLDDTATYRNYVWLADSVPEPGTWALITTGLALAALRRRKRPL